MTENAQPQFALQRVYVKDASIEVPNAPMVFTKEWKPEIKLDLNTGARRVDESHFEVFVKVTATAKLADDETAFLVEVMQCGLFLADNIPEEQLKPMMGAMCPNILFPYLRESVDSLVVKGGFPALMLAPINFDALFAQRMQQEAEEAVAAPEATH
ncbi:MULTISPECIES: protein-export chaperone SecB [unclassified Oceanobacter]|jgi:preprotein translocase subunit SecB|uniref:protein-export chaperone SecB n=1 Tax=unclassified Oceanobacter TaxID=2620260 RepID=UPI0026E396AC|nr:MULTISPECIES: protein-export chaperone SecB [unclassified Oceanobacter]MDO6681887.1 protein-export chaperone SecB [Oceanobacter sp. 5_MG-2023]MDP2505249.1 protein-export chaperone SecB [Oceanobacter sp. 3_MG-2023]MDP2549265.1 protein-export chaperone SecB [Oceanobacter sp. 4_MG-2023]MDP2607926.1 protein-export chaperone SecB [Oceanobacter sp. 1_MG-2023]MDP2611412.1 protein-export chaperone SecB [Oceanobacter sp. 2_MG-2023]